MVLMLHFVDVYKLKQKVCWRPSSSASNLKRLYCVGCYLMMINFIYKTLHTANLKVRSKKKRRLLNPLKSTEKAKQQQ